MIPIARIATSRTQSRMRAAFSRTGISINASSPAPAKLIHPKDAFAALLVLAVVLTVTVGLAALELVKSTVWVFTVSLEVTTQLALGALVLQEKATRPVPIVPTISIVVVFPVVAPALTVMFPLGVICGGEIAEGRYCRT
jgi:hypothetical protein